MSPNRSKILGALRQKFARKQFVRTQSAVSLERMTERVNKAPLAELIDIEASLRQHKPYKAGQRLALLNRIKARRALLERRDRAIENLEHRHAEATEDRKNQYRGYR